MNNCISLNTKKRKKENNRKFIKLFNRQTLLRFLFYIDRIFYLTLKLALFVTTMEQF